MTLVVGDDFNSSTSLNTTPTSVSLSCYLTESGWNGLPNARISSTKICGVISYREHEGGWC